ncbi:hypothetical protein VPH35_069134 [Triticum aestivum]
MPNRIYSLTVFLNLSRLRLGYVSVDAILVRSYIEIPIKKLFYFFILCDLIETWLNPPTPIHTPKLNHTPHTFTGLNHSKQSGAFSSPSDGDPVSEANPPLSTQHGGAASHSSATCCFSPAPHEAMATSPALLSRQYARPSHPLPRQLLAPSPVAVAASPAVRLRVRRGPTPAQAKFGKFDAADAPTEAGPTAPATSEADGAAGKAVLEDDSCLPSDLEGAIWQSGKASADFVNSGGMRGIAELLIPQLEFLNQEGAQAEVWALSRILLDTLAEETGQVVKAVFPDAGVAALLKHQWKDAKFKCASLSDRKPVDTDDGVVVMIIPDHQMLESVERIASQLADDPF